MGEQDPLHRVEPAERHDVGRGRERPRHRDVFGNRAGPVGRPGVDGFRIDRDLDRVVVAVVAALDLDDPLATGDGPHQVQGGHRGLGAGVGEAPQRQPEAAGELDRDGDQVGHRLGEVGAEPDPPADRLDDRRVGVADHHRAEAGVQVDVLVAVDVPHVRSPCRG